jgi:hypothetical protein
MFLLSFIFSVFVFFTFFSKICENCSDIEKIPNLETIVLKMFQLSKNVQTFENVLFLKFFKF